MRRSGSIGLFSKTEFILAFAALLIGFASFNAELQKITIDLGFRSCNFWELSLFSFSILFFSIYLFAIDSVRYGVSFLEGLKFFKYLRDLAHIVYFLAIIFPLLVFLVWAIVAIISKLPLPEARYNTESVAVVFTTILSLVFVISALRQVRVQGETLKERINERASELLMKTDRSSKNRNWRSVVIETFRLLELMIKNKAEDFGIDARRVPFIRLVRILVGKELINKEQAAKLDELREIRNLAVHSEESITKEQATFATSIVDEVSRTLASSQFRASYFEGMVLGVLSKLFSKYHTFPQFKVGAGRRVDFIAEGPGYKYFIEIKMTESPSVIRKAARQLQAFLGENDRGLLVLPISAKRIELIDHRIKFLFFDIRNGKFSNESEIYDWIYD